MVRYWTTAKRSKKLMMAHDGTDRLETRPFVDAPVAIEVARIIEALGDRKLFIGGRGLLKSTFIIGSLLQGPLKNPDMATLLIRSSLKRSQEHIAKLIEEINLNAELVDLFPDVFWRNSAERKGKGVAWGNERLVFRRTVSRLEGSIDAAGILDGLPIGVHYDRIIGDDLEDPKVVSGERFWGLKAGFNAVNPLLAGHGSTFCAVGTYHHSQGLHAEDMPNAGWGTTKLPSVYTDDVPDGFIEVEIGGTKRSVFWRELGGRPRYEPASYLATQYVGMGKLSYDTQYLCMRPTESVKILDPDKLVRFDHWHSVPEAIRDRCTMVLLSDPASGKKVTSDPSAFIVAALYKNRGEERAYIVDGWYSALLRPTGRVRVAMHLIKKWRCRWVRIENPNFCMDDDELREALRREGIEGVTVQGISPDRNKAEAVESFLAPRLDRREIYISTTAKINTGISDKEVPEDKPMDLHSLIVQEFVRFVPDKQGSEHCIDALNLLRQHKDVKRIPNVPWGLGNKGPQRIVRDTDPLTRAIFG